MAWDFTTATSEKAGRKGSKYQENLICTGNNIAGASTARKKDSIKKQGTNQKVAFKTHFFSICLLAASGNRDLTGENPFNLNRL